MKIDSFLAELKRRNVYKVAVAYAVVSWLLVQVAFIVFPTFDAPPAAMKILLVLALFRIDEDMYYQHQEGQRDDRVWGGFVAIMRDINVYAGIQAWWRTRSHWFSQQFSQFIAERQTNAGAPSMYREIDRRT